MTDQSSHEKRLSPGGRAPHPAEASTVTQHHGRVVSEAPTVVRGGSEKARPAQPPRDPNALVQGERLDHFELQEYIDVGGMGTVFRAWDTKLHRQVAVKVLPQEYADNRESVQRFLQEARAAAQLNHENISRVYFAGQSHDMAYIVFEYVEGLDARRLLQQRGAFTSAEVVNYAIQIASALKHACACDVVHRDIKPSNIVITPDGRAKLVDMGLARNFDTRSGLTVSGVTLGTFDYLSPEQAEDPRMADVRSDIYSLGCTLFHMITGQPPFPEGNALQKMLLHRQETPPDPRKFDRGIPVRLSSIIQKMMNKKPNERYQNADHLLQELTFLAGELGLKSTTPDGLIWVAPGSVPVSTWQRHAIWLLPMTILMLAALLVELVSQSTETGLDDDSLLSLQQANVSLSEDSQNEVTVGESIPLPERQEPFLNKGDVEEIPQVSSDLSPDLQRTMSSEPELSGPGKNGLPSNPTVPRAFDLFVDSEEFNPLGDENSPSVEPLTVDINELSPEPREPADVTTELQNGLVPEDGASSVPAPEVSGVLVVDPMGTENTYSTLRDAVRDAIKRSITEIEIRSNGRLREGPIQISGLRRLIIRAGEGFRPTLVFDPERTSAEVQQQFITVREGTLDLINLDLELDVPEGGQPGDWKLLSFQSAEGMTLQGCTLTLSNRFSQRASLISAVWPRVAGIPDVGNRDNESSDRTVILEFRGCFFRGGADVLYLSQPPEIRVELRDNNVVAVANRLMVVEMQQGSESKVSLEMSHLTARVDNGLLLVDSRGTSVPDIDIVSDDNIFVTSPQASLVTHRGEATVSAFRTSLQWEGHRNFYERTVDFWAIESTAPSLMMSGNSYEKYNFEDWAAIWKNHVTEPQIDRVRWATTVAESLPLWKINPEDFILDPLENPAVKGASDGRDAGADIAGISNQNSRRGTPLTP